MNSPEDNATRNLRDTLKKWAFPRLEYARQVGSPGIRAIGHAARLLSARAAFEDYQGKPLTLEAVHAAQTLAIVEGDIASTRLSKDASDYSGVLDAQLKRFAEPDAYDSFTNVYFREYSNVGMGETRRQRVVGAMTWLLEDLNAANVHIDEMNRTSGTQS
jgi:hypothetical protein